MKNSPRKQKKQEPFEMSLMGELNSEKADEFLKNFKQCDMEGPVKVFMNSGGGDVTAGISIYEIIKCSRHPVEICCVGMVGSMASLVFQAADIRTMTEGSVIMFHDFSMGGDGTLAQLKAHVIESERCKQWYCTQISNRTGIKIEDVLKWTDKETFFTAEESLKLKLTDKIIPYRKKVSEPKKCLKK